MNSGKKSNSVEILDTTLRDGAQGEGISFSVQDKLAVVRALDELGVAWIEAGNPGSNPKDMEFFRLAGELRLKNSKLCAFGSTRKKDLKPEADPQVKSLLTANTPAVVIFGKSWDLHVREVLRVSPEENIAMIAETAAFLKAWGKTLIYDAEHFFDGWLANPDYALATVKAAIDAGADRIALCDTNGGCFPDTIAEGLRAVLALAAAAGSEALIGIHAHDDSGFANANTAAAVKAGARHIQGTLVGFGERCGNTSLAAVIPSIEIKLGYPCLPAGKLELLCDTTRAVAEIANVSVPDNLPYVGAHAFSHKAGMHADAIIKIRESFEHIDPALVGNDRHFLMSEVGGRSAIAERAKKIDPSITKDHPVTAALANKLKKLEAEGWQFEGADGSFELLVRRELVAQFPERHATLLPEPLFSIEAYRVVSEHPTGETLACSHAWVKVLVDGQHEIAAAEGDGPVNAMDGALRRALTRFYPELEKVRLSDYKVRVIDGIEATAAKVRVLIESTDGVNVWTTVGVSADIIDASRAALVDSIEYKLIGDMEKENNDE
ncbi:citramalate synthase [Treponema primitia]|uniref:citramalate synthase n=1 Tax=Treponema primitia TaxID=88058 RepID=UPI00025556E9|nr:citramalate synthase [Treponema primitia]